MRSCPNCKAVFGDDEVFCPVCGQEIQIVPDFETVESKYQELKRKSEAEHRARQEELERQLILRRRIKQRRRNIILVIVLALAAVAAVFCVMHFRKTYNESQSFEFQLAKANECFMNEEYLEAETAVRQAIALDGTSVEAKLLAARIFLKNEKADDAEDLLMAIIEEDPSNTEAYTVLIEQYQKEERKNDIQTVLRACENTSVLKMFADYLPDGPALSPEEGIYNSDQEIVLTADTEGTIYYTTDGSEPSRESSIYTDPITLTEGITTIKAIIVTQEDFSSPVSAGVYQILYDAPPAPEITPDSGEYSIIRRVNDKGVLISESDEEKKITLTYPDGYTCHYSFDKKPTEESPVYTRPVKMEQGDHIFYAVLESETGKLGVIASATYKYEIRTVTPTPAPVVRPNYRRPAATATPEPTETAAPTETPSDSGGGSTPAPTETPSEDPNGNSGDVPADNGDAGGSGETPAGGGGDAGGSGETPSGGGDNSGGSGGGSGDGGSGGGSAEPSGGGTAPAGGDTGGSGGGETAPAAPAPQPDTAAAAE